MSTDSKIDNPASRWRKKPVVIDAMQLIDDLGNHHAVARWITDNGGKVIMPALDPWLLIETLEGQMRANIGDYVIKGVVGEFYPCRPDIFEATYEPAEVSELAAWLDNRPIAGNVEIRTIAPARLGRPTIRDLDRHIATVEAERDAALARVAELEAETGRLTRVLAGARVAEHKTTADLLHVAWKHGVPLVCRTCGHGGESHDAEECWYTSDGPDTRCTCGHADLWPRELTIFTTPAPSADTVREV